MASDDTVVPAKAGIQAFCEQHPASTYWLAYSGGVDSHALLALFVNARKTRPLNLRAIHINHGLSPHADAWAQHCISVCQALEVDVVVHRVSVENRNGQSLEEAAREQRYAVFARLLQPDDLLVTAHHQDDQAETLLLQLLRGAGVKGLSAMPVVKPFAQARHARPLLSFSRAELLAYAAKERLIWIEDESNLNKQFTRNFIRHDLLPLLATREPAVKRLLARSAAHCAEAQDLLNEYASIDLLRCVGSREDTLSVQALSALSPARQRLLLRTWIHARGFRLPDHRRLASILRDVLTADWDRLPCVRWGEVELRRHGDDLYLLNTETKSSNQCDNYKALQQLDSAITVKYREGGEVVRMPGRGAQSLKNLFQEWRVPPWERDQIPLLCVGDNIIAVVGYFLHPEYAYLQLPLP